MKTFFKLSIRIYIILFVIILLTTNNTYAFDSLCNNNEKTFFSCTLKNTKQLSICGLEKEKKLFIHYKFGQPIKTEMVFPKYTQNNNKTFKYNHYSRYQTDYFRIVFTNNGYKYEIYRNYEAESSNKITAGVNITNLVSKKTYNLLCKAIKIDEINQLSNLLACDKDNALGCDF